MGHFSIVYGYIAGNGAFEDHNAAQIAALPQEDTYPELTRDMFVLPQQQYSEPIILFGGTYNGVETAWETWLEKFEGLLRSMYWDKARVHLRTELWGNYDYQWEPDHPHPVPPDFVPTPIQKWKFSGGPRHSIRQKAMQKRRKQ